MTDADHAEVTPAERDILHARLHRAVPPAPTTTGWVAGAASIRRRRRHALTALSAVALIAMSSAAAASVLADRSSPPSAGSPGTATVYLLDINAQTTRWQHYLAPVQVEVPGRDPAALEAARALVNYRPPKEEPLLNGWNMLTIAPESIADVVDVRLQDGLITVELDRDAWDPYPTILCECPPGRAVLQQLIYTVQTALDSDAPVQVTFEGEPARGVWLSPTRHPIYADPEAK